MKYWMFGNKTWAESRALHFVIGYLTEAKKHQKKISIDEILRYIEKAVADETAELDRLHPEYAHE